jgi:hypothetical protein
MLTEESETKIETKINTDTKITRYIEDKKLFAAHQYSTDSWTLFVAQTKALKHDVHNA